MNLLQSEKTYDELLLLMDTYGYSAQHIKRVKREIKWLAANQDDHNNFLRGTAPMGICWPSCGNPYFGGIPTAS